MKILTCFVLRQLYSHICLAKLILSCSFARAAFPGAKQQERINFDKQMCKQSCRRTTQILQIRLFHAADSMYHASSMYFYTSPLALFSRTCRPIHVLWCPETTGHKTWNVDLPHSWEEALFRIFRNSKIRVAPFPWSLIVWPGSRGKRGWPLFSNLDKSKRMGILISEEVPNPKCLNTQRAMTCGREPVLNRFFYSFPSWAFLFKWREACTLGKHIELCAWLCSHVIVFSGGRELVLKANYDEE